MGVPNPSQAAFVAFSEAEAANICTTLGIDSTPNGQWLPKVAKYIRCNGLGEIRQAAGETSLTMRKAHRSTGPPVIGDPWAYAVRVANGNWARNRELYVRLGLYENAVRAKVAALVTHHLGAGWWAISPAPYMSVTDWQHMLQSNSKVRAQRPTTAVPVPPMRVFPSAERFVGELTLKELHAIVQRLKSTLFDYVLLDAAGRPFVRSKLESTHLQIEATRNDVMHARAIPMSAYPKKRNVIDAMLEALEFDVAKTLANIRSAPA